MTSHAFFLPTSEVRRFGFRGGKSKFQPAEPAPTVEILFPDPVQIAGYRTQSCDHDDEDLTFWAGSDTVLSSWHYDHRHSPRGLAAGDFVWLQHIILV